MPAGAFHELGSANGVALQWGTGLQWSIVLAAIVAGLILLTIGISAFVYRGRQSEGLWVNFVALCFLPMFLVVFGNATIWECSKQDVFCASCHSMQPYVDDMKRPGSDSLAALHYQDRFANGVECYSCHVNYGVHGTFAAKLLGLHDAWNEAIKRYRVPIKMRQPFPNELCLKCHDGGRDFMAEESHLGSNHKLSPDFLDGQSRCTDCHRPAHSVVTAAFERERPR